MYAYAEFLRRTGRDAIAAISGIPSKEALFVMRKFRIRKPSGAEALISRHPDVIIVDVSSVRNISSRISPESVIEVIDHRKVNYAHEFPKAKVQIEQVGTAATLIAEKFFSRRLKPSRESAILLYSAIISNTVNFRANVATGRDRKMAAWLKGQIKLPPNFVHEMFAAKSRFDARDLRQVLENDSFTYDFAGKKVSVAQLEIIAADKFISRNIGRIMEILKGLKEKNGADMAFLTCIDIEAGFNLLVAIDEDTKNILEKALKVRFEGSVARRKGIIMRKEILPLIKEILEKNPKHNPARI